MITLLSFIIINIKLVWDKFENLICARDKMTDVLSETKRHVSAAIDAFPASVKIDSVGKHQVDSFVDSSRIANA